MFKPASRRKPLRRPVSERAIVGAHASDDGGCFRCDHHHLLVYSARAAAGWRLFDRFWIGPEVSVSTDRFSTQYRIGTHLTGFKTGMLEWSVGAGLVEDSFDRSGIYGRVSALFRK